MGTQIAHSQESSIQEIMHTQTYLSGQADQGGRPQGKKMSRLDRKYWVIKQVARMLLVTITIQMFVPRQVKALTTGPSQPEVMQFQQAGTSGMVDPFTGAFNYNIPLFELPGPNGSYPFNLAYQSGVTMDQEASWVGLGWSLNPGAITRTMRGLPDEFNGDEVHIDQDMKPDWTVGVGMKVSAEIFGADLGIASGNVGGISGSTTLYYNSYRGMGYRIDGGASYNEGIGNNMLAGFGLNLSLDSQDGIGLNPQLNLGGYFESKNNLFGAGIGYNSRRGLTDLSLSMSRTNKRNETNQTTPFRGVASFVPAASAYTPTISQEMVGVSIAITPKLGTASGPDPYFSFPGYYQQNSLRRDSIDVPGFGYMNMQDTLKRAMLDVNRESDGPLRKEMPNLPAPILTNDIYEISGQGTGGYFRAWRNDVPVVGNSKQVSFGINASAGFEVNATKLGVDFGAGVSRSHSGVWMQKNEVLNSTNVHHYGYDNGRRYQRDYEPWYFKLGGEISSRSNGELAYVNGEEAIRIAIDKENDNGRGVGVLRERLEDVQGNTISNLPPQSLYPTQPQRQARNTVVTHVKNGELSAAGMGMGEYQIKHFVTNAASFTPNHASPNIDLNRNRPAHHFAGMTVHQTDGNQYVYALPAYNEKQVENLFSVDGHLKTCSGRIDIDKKSPTEIKYKIDKTDELLHRTEIPAFAHSHLLTSVLGQDYVDADAIPGPSDGDLGYWVKFNYVKIQVPYKWRAPFIGANFDKGNLSDLADDKGSYMYGVREQWYLASAETKTHIAEFHIGERLDSRGANDELQNSDNLIAGNAYGAHAYRLEKIELFSKLELQAALSGGQTPVPLKVVEFGYDYSLCPNVINNENFVGSNGNDGKLTLKSVSFTHENSSRGSQNPYSFEYNNLNPTYDELAQDKWGNYRQNLDPCRNASYPYVDQNTPRATLDAQNAAWHLSTIHIPTGGTITVDYEANDYAYVQDKPAMEMYRVTGMKQDNDDVVYNNYDENDEQDRRIYIELGRNLHSNSELADLIAGQGTVYLKTLIDLKDHQDLIQEFVSSYLSIDPTKTGFECSPLQVSTTGCSRIHITLKKCDWNGAKWEGYHPVAIAAWNYLRSNLPKFAYTPSFATNQDPGTSQFALQQQLASLISVGVEFTNIFKGFYGHAEGSDWAHRFVPASSWVRLNSLDGKKVGGGCRVKKITLNDAFAAPQSTSGLGVTTGVVYDYTTIEQGRSISSGVAAYEPLIGGDENPLRQNRRYPNETPLLTPYNLFAQLPVNESYMPSPTIGYSRVTVKSLATQQVTDAQLAATIPTTGAVVHEFYTAKDFPVEFSETKVNMRPFNLPIYIPLIGLQHFNDLTGTQGYSITLNDMHGRPKSVTNYGQDIQGHLLWDNPISWVKYHYSETVDFAGTAKERHHLQNQLSVLRGDVDPGNATQSDITSATLGQAHEFFVDMRESASEALSLGIQNNVDFWTLPSWWPSINSSKSNVRTAVTNKIIHRSGILIGTEASNQGSLVKTVNLLFDAQTGRPLLTRVTNDYDAPIYSYEYPAFWAYDQMGPGYKNIGVMFDSTLVTNLGNNIYTATKIPSPWVQPTAKDLMVPGDELIAIADNGTKAKAVFIGFDGDNAKFYCESNIVGQDVSFRIVRSGRRNLLSVPAEQIVSLRNPTINRGNQSCWVDVEDPTAVVESTWVETHVIDQYVLAPCMANIPWILNQFYQDPLSNYVPGGYNPWHPATPTTFGCGPCAIVTLNSDNYEEVTIECGQNSCTFSLVDIAGTAIPISSISSVSNLAVVPAASGYPIASGAAFGISIQALVAGSSAPITLWFSGCENLLGQGVQTIQQEVNIYHSNLTATPNDHVLQTDMFMLDSVLSATATTFSDAWMQDFSDVRFASGNPTTQMQRLEAMHPFANAQRGVWRPKESYVYATDRRQSNEVNTAKDGTFSGMPMFDFQSITFGDCSSNWRKTNEITRYSPYGNELENRDVLNVYSAALYGYNGKLPIAVSANADYREVGFESFEEYVPNQSVNVLQMATGNLSLPSDLSGATAPTVWSYTDISYGDDNHFYLLGSMTNSILIHPIPGSMDAMVQGRTHGSTFAHSIPFAEKQGATILTSAINTSVAPYLHRSVNPNSEHYAGRVVYQRPTLPFVGAVDAMSYSDDKAHTGKMSMKLTGKLEVPQSRLKLKEGEQYTIQLWVSRANTDVPTFRDATIVNPLEQLGVAIGFFDKTHALIGGSGILEPSGELVEGWQKIEGNFTVPVGTENIGLRLYSGVYDKAVQTTYFDDIRIQPLKSKMTCYVYDPSNYKLRATLDDDNFALIYRYDEAGNLFLVQKETVEGMRTIQESRSFMTGN